MKHSEKKEYIVSLAVFVLLFLAIGMSAKGYYDMSRLYQNFTLPENYRYLWFVNFFDYSHVILPARSESRIRSVGGILFPMALFPLLIYLPLFSYLRNDKKAAKKMLLWIMAIVSVLYHAMAVYMYLVVLKSPVLLAYTALSFVLSIVLIVVLIAYNDFYEFIRKVEEK